MGAPYRLRALSGDEQKKKTLILPPVTIFLLSHQNMTESTQEIEIQTKTLSTYTDIMRVKKLLILYKKFQIPLLISVTPLYSVEIYASLIFT